jgi:hypothetical protein
VAKQIGIEVVIALGRSFVAGTLMDVAPRRRV